MHNSYASLKEASIICTVTYTHNVLQVKCVAVVHHGELPRESQGVHATSLAGQAAHLGTVCAMLILTIFHSYSRVNH
jgi:hypothetical protein